MQLTLGQLNRLRLNRINGLLVLNGLLLATLGSVVFGPLATAQDRRRAEYVATSGTIKGADAAAVWIVDQTNLELIAVIWDGNAGRIVGLGYRDLVADMGQASRGARN